jgi:hypothetical protein
MDRTRKTETIAAPAARSKISRRMRDIGPTLKRRPGAQPGPNSAG